MSTDMPTLVEMTQALRESGPGRPLGSHPVVQKILAAKTEKRPKLVLLQGGRND